MCNCMCACHVMKYAKNDTSSFHSEIQGIINVSWKGQRSEKEKVSTVQATSNGCHAGK